MTDCQTLHATCVAIDGQAVLLTGPSGSGKSDLALRLIDRGAALISDDLVVVRKEGSDIIAASPGKMVGRIEVRGVGICRVDAVAEAPARLLVRLGEEGARLPEAMTELIAGISLPLLCLDAHRASAPLKVEMALRQGVGTE